MERSLLLGGLRTAGRLALKEIELKPLRGLDSEPGPEVASGVAGDDSTARRERGSLSATGLDLLLNALDADRDLAAEKYEATRRKLTRLFEWWGAGWSDRLADETLTRVARKLEEGVVIQAGNTAPYVRGVARLVFLESIREQERERKAAASSTEILTFARDESEQGLTCLDGCLEQLASDQRSLILEYYGSGEAEGRIASRRKLAMRLGLSAPVLRLKAHRLREKLEKCVVSCLERAGE